MTTLNEIKIFLNISLTNNEFDTLLTSLIAEATETINNYCGYNLVQNVKEYHFIGNNKNDVFLPFPNVTNAADCEYRIRVGSWVAMDVELYQINNSYFIYSDTLFAENTNYKVDLTIGYETIPNDVKHVCKELTAIMFRESGVKQGRLNNTIGLQSVSETANSITTNTVFKSKFSEISHYLDKYKYLVF